RGSPYSKEQVERHQRRLRRRWYPHAIAKDYRKAVHLASPMTAYALARYAHCNAAATGGALLWVGTMPRMLANYFTATFFSSYGTVPFSKKRALSGHSQPMPVFGGCGWTDDCYRRVAVGRCRAVEGRVTDPTPAARPQ